MLSTVSTSMRMRFGGVIEYQIVLSSPPHVRAGSSTATVPSTVFRASWKGSDGMAVALSKSSFAGTAASAGVAQHERNVTASAPPTATRGHFTGASSHLFGAAKARLASGSL